MPEPAIQAIGLRKSYPGGSGAPPVQALDGLTFDAFRGTVLGMLGPNGAGKSTTVKILATLSRAEAGEARVDGIDVARDPGAVRRRIGLVSQRPSSDPMATGRENLVLAGRLHGMNRVDAADRATALLARFGLADAADRLVRTWSGGMSRKLDVAIGLVNRPALLFLDEPTTGLDPEARAELWGEIERLTREDETTVLLTTHYLDEADRLAGVVAILDQGRIRVQGSPDSLKAELRGDTITLGIAGGPDGEAAIAQVESVPGVFDVTLTDGTLRARAEAGARAVPLILAALDQSGVDVASATVARPSLDDVYLRHVGRTFEAVA